MPAIRDGRFDEIELGPAADGGPHLGRKPRQHRVGVARGHGAKPLGFGEGGPPAGEDADRQSQKSEQGDLTAAQIRALMRLVREEFR